MKRSLLALVLGLLVLLHVPLSAAIAVVQVQTGSANDVVITFGSAWGASNHVLVAVIVNSGTQTVDLTGITPTETVLHSQADVGLGLTGYVFCFPGDGADTSFTATTSGSGSARVAAIEISGGTCTEDGTSSGNTDTASPYELATDITTTQSGSILIGIIHSTSVADFTVSGSGTSVPADGTDIGTVALGQYLIAGAAGAYDTTFTSAAAESTLQVAAAVQAAGGAAPAKPKGLLTFGVGRP